MNQKEKEAVERGKKKHIISIRSCGPLVCVCVCVTERKKKERTCKQLIIITLIAKTVNMKKWRMNIK